MKYFVRLNLKSNSRKNTQEVNTFFKSPSPFQFRKSYPQFETWKVLSNDPEGYALENKAGSVMRNLKNADPTGGVPEVGDDVIVGFYNSDRSNAFILSKGLNKLLGGTSVPIRLAGWYRRSARTTGRYFPDVLEDTVLSIGSVTPSGERDPGRIIRAFSAAEGFDRVWSEAWSVVINGVVQNEGEPGSDVVALWASGGVRLVMVEGAVEVEDPYTDGYEAGYDSGYNDPGEYLPPYDAGSSACYNGTGYDPFFDYPFPAAPGGHSEDWEYGWTDGHLAGYTARYDEGYRAEGCTI